MTPNAHTFNAHDIIDMITNFKYYSMKIFQFLQSFMLWNFLKYHTNDSLPLLLSCSRLVPSFQYPTFYFSLLLFPPIYFSFFFFTSVSFPTLSFFIHVFFSSFPFLRFPYLFSLPFHTCFCNSCFTLELVADLSNFSACSLDNQRILT